MGLTCTVFYVILQCWIQLFGVFFVFFVTLTCFPAIQAGVMRSSSSFFITGNIYLLLPKEKLISHSSQGFAKNVELYLLQNYQVTVMYHDKLSIKTTIYFIEYICIKQSVAKIQLPSSVVSSTLLG